MKSIFAGDRVQGSDKHAGVHGGRLLPGPAAGPGYRAQHPAGGDERGQAGAGAVRPPLPPPHLPAQGPGAQLQIPGQGQGLCQVPVYRAFLIY